MNKLRKYSKQKPSRLRVKDTRGMYKLAIYFIDHKQPNGRAYYFYSTRRQDQDRTAKRRLKYLVNKKWAGLIHWAGLYYHNQLIQEFKIADNQWQDNSKVGR